MDASDPYQKQALRRLMETLTGNGISDGDIKVISAATEQCLLTETLSLEVAHTITHTLSPGEAPPTGSFAADSVDAAGTAAKRQITTVHSAGKIYDATAACVLAQSYKGLNFTKAVHTLPDFRFNYHHVHQCETCSGAGKFLCTTCKQTGRLMCDRCHGAKNVQCSGCNGVGQTRCTMIGCVNGRFTCVNCSGRGQVEQTCLYCNGSGYQYNSTYRCMNCSGGRRTVTCNACGGDSRCRNCMGSGWLSCSTCGRRGWVQCARCDGHGNIQCSACSGKGERQCDTCKGHQKVTAITTLQYQVTTLRTGHVNSSSRADSTVSSPASDAHCTPLDQLFGKGNDAISVAISRNSNGWPKLEYSYKVPRVQMTVRIHGTQGELRTIGVGGHIVAQPPVINDIINRARTILQQAAKMHWPYSQLLVASQLRIVRDLLRWLVKNESSSALERLQKQYGHAMTGAIAVEMINNASKAAAKSLRWPLRVPLTVGFLAPVILAISTSCHLLLPLARAVSYGSDDSFYLFIEFIVLCVLSLLIANRQCRRTSQKRLAALLQDPTIPLPPVFSDPRWPGRMALSLTITLSILWWYSY